MDLFELTRLREKLQVRHAATVLNSFVNLGYIKRTSSRSLQRWTARQIKVNEWSTLDCFVRDLCFQSGRIGCAKALSLNPTFKLV